MLKPSSHRNRGDESRANYTLGSCRINSRVHGQMSAFENPVRRRRSDWCGGPVRPCRPNTWRGRLSDYRERRCPADQHFGQQLLGLARDDFHSKLCEVPLIDRTIINQPSQTQKCTHVDRRYQKASAPLYLRLECPSRRARLPGR